MTLKKVLLASAACVAFSASNALAFDEVAWTWDGTVTSDVTVTADIAVDAVPTGLIQVENIQTQTGDVTATSTVTGINNNAGSEDGIFVFDDTIELEATFDDNGADNPITEVTILAPPGVTGSNGSGNVDNNTETVSLTFDLEGELEAEAASVAAVDLPMIDSTATAVGNNYAVDGTVAIALDSEQSLAGGDGAATVEAISSVSEILNAAVDSSATAVGNNMAVTLADAAAGDEVMIADITQTSLAGVTASSSVTDVELVNYTGFGDANMGALAEDQIAAISSVATAVGNNLAISVGGTTPVPAPGI